MIKKKICFVITDLGSFYNFLIELVEYLCQKHEFDIILITSSTKVIDITRILSPNVVKQIYFVDIPRGVNLFKILKCSIKIRSIIKHESPDLVNVHFTTSILPTILFKCSNLMYVGFFHGLGYPLERGWKRFLRFFVEVISFAKLDKIILLNNFDVSFIPNYFKNKVYVIKSKGLGCDLNKFTPKKVKCGVNTNFGFSGRFVEFKGFNIVVRFFFKFNSMYPNSRLTLIGDFDRIHHSGLNREELEMIRNHPNILITGFTNDVNYFLDDIDYFLFFSQREGVPVSLIEAMSKGITCIALNVRGASELIINGINGYLINPSDEDKVISNTINIVTSDSNSSDFIFKNLMNEKQWFSRQNFVQEFSKYIVEILE